MSAARPPSEVAADLRNIADRMHAPEKHPLREAAALIEALVAERDTAQAEVGRLEAEKQFPLVRLGVGADRLDVAQAFDFEVPA